MIEFPDNPRPNRMTSQMLDYGSIQRGSASLRVDRPGNRYRIEFGYPREAMPPEVARVFASRMVRAKREGIRIYLPVLYDAGFPGSPVVNGAGQAGNTLVVRGFNTGYIAREGAWFTAIEADGTAYLHQVVAATVVADALGNATLEIEPPLRAPFADGATLEFRNPYVEGFIAADNVEWETGEAKYTSFTLIVEEYQ